MYYADGLVQTSMHMGKLVSKEFDVRELEDVEDNTRGIFDGGLEWSECEDTESGTSVGDGESDEESDDEGDEESDEVSGEPNASVSSIAANKSTKFRLTGPNLSP